MLCVLFTIYCLNALSASKVGKVSAQNQMYRILSSIMYIQVKFAPEFHNDFGHFFIYFSRIISQELIIASLFIIKAILNLSQLPSMYSVLEIFQHLFQCKKVRTILYKIQ
jgi:hypothetical protein